MQLRRLQFPLKLAAAETIHSMQGITVPRLAMYLDDDFRHMMWSRAMLFSILTRVQRLSDLWICGFSEDVLLALLGSRTAWHGEVDAWLDSANIMAPAPNALRRTGLSLGMLPALRFQHEQSLTLPPSGLVVVYVLQSLSGPWYVGWTDNMVFRLGRHNAGMCLASRHCKDWLLRAYVHNFGGCSRAEQVCLARRLEWQLQHGIWNRNSLLDWAQLIWRCIGLWKETHVPGGMGLRLELDSMAML